MRVTFAFGASGKRVLQTIAGRFLSHCLGREGKGKKWVCPETWSA